MEFKRNKHELQSIGNTAVNVIGLTGGIASGKTVAEAALTGAGYFVIDADEVSRRLFAADTDGEKTLCKLFPEANSNGRLDRAKLRAIISRDNAARHKLNDCTHPLIIDEIKKIISATPPPVVLSAPLLFETSLAALCDVTVCIYCPTAERVKRLCARDGVCESDARAIIKAQIPDTERCTIADFVVPSDRDRQEFEREVLELFGAIVNPKLRK